MPRTGDDLPRLLADQAYRAAELAGRGSAASRLVAGEWRKAFALWIDHELISSGFSVVLA